MASVLAILLAATFLARSTGGSGGGPISDEQRAANATTAKYAADFDTVCKTGSVSNAASYSKPHTVIAFYQGNDGDYWSRVTLDRQAGIYAETDAVSSIDVVACLTRHAGSEVKSGSCDFDSQGETLTVDRYAVEYDVELHEAKTGKTITSLGTVNGPATRCPFLAYFDRESPKIYAAPDAAAVEVELTDFAGR